MFAPPPPKQHPVKEVWGIFGDEVLIKNKWYKVGDTVGDAKVVAIGPTSVKIEWDGKEKVFAPIDAAGPPEPRERKRAEPPAKEAAKGGAEMVEVQPEPRPMFGRGGMEGPGRMRERWESMSEKERERFRTEMQERRERFMNMSEAERERFRDEMRERFGGGRGDGRGPGGRR